MIFEEILQRYREVQSVDNKFNVIGGMTIERTKGK